MPLGVHLYFSFPDNFLQFTSNQAETWYIDHDVEQHIVSRLQSAKY